MTDFNRTAARTAQTLSLRPPLREALNIVAQLASELPLGKTPNLEEDLATVNGICPTCTDFEYDFPSVAFSIATGVGKTRLMAACIVYLMRERGIRNFFVLVPNGTLYEKMKRDFGEPGYEKYVFRGIREFVNEPPRVIHGENYRDFRTADATQMSFAGMTDEERVHINVFNIQKFYKENQPGKGKKDKGKPPRMRRLLETLGSSYWDYLTSRPDLVLLMDEAHRYRANSSRRALNELQPVLGLEMTATPFYAQGGKDKPFRNVVYEYSLAHALNDGKYVKMPKIATRANLDSQKRNDDEIEELQLHDATAVHQRTRDHLEHFAAERGLPRVKPFMLVVCKDTSHAAAVEERLRRPDFFDGYYRDRVLRVDSTTMNEDAIAAQFLTLEQTDNDIEIVLHVNMLKEGWDVRNLYTIVPLRAASAPVLVEQTIGRGLRLPYGGKRTGDVETDTLTIMAHRSFAKIVAAAQDPNSILNKTSLVEMDDEALRPERQETFQSESPTERAEREEAARVETIDDPEQRKQARTDLTVKRKVREAIRQAATQENVRTMDDLTRPDVVDAVTTRVAAEIQQRPTLFSGITMAETKREYEREVRHFRERTIPIPRITLRVGVSKTWFEDVELNLGTLNINRDRSQIIRQHLRTRDGLEREYLSGGGGGARDTPVNTLVATLLDYGEITYDRDRELLFDLAGRVCDHLNKGFEDEQFFADKIHEERKRLGKFIYDQMMRCYQVHYDQLEQPEVLPFDRIEPHHYQRRPGQEPVSIREPYDSDATVRRTIFTGFQRAYHEHYKFDSKQEQWFALLCERDPAVLRWLRPARAQFHLYWDRNRQRYEPDFVVETTEVIYLVEIKAARDMDRDEVEQKQRAAETYCAQASAYNAEHGGKPWRYVLIPHTAVRRDSTLGGLIAVD